MGVTEYVALPANARRCIERLAALVGLSFDFIPTGPDRVQTILLRHPLG